MLISILTTLVIVLGIVSYYLFVIAPKLNPFNRAETFEKQGNLKEALIEYKKVLDKKPDDFLVHYRLGSIYHKLKEYDQSAIHLERVIDIDEYNYQVDKLNVQKKLIDIYFYREDIELVYKNYYDILKLRPGDIEALYYVAFISLGQEEFEIAWRYFDRLAKMKKDDFDIQFGAGICSYQNQKINEAVEYFKTALVLNNSSEIANLSISFSLYRQKDYRQASSILEKFIESDLSPEVEFLARRLNAFFNIHMKKYDAGIRYFEDILHLAKKNNMNDEVLLTLYDLGYACISGERTDSAYEYWDELYQMDKSYKNIDSLVTTLRQEMDIDIKKMKDGFHMSVYDTVEEWMHEAFDPDFLWEICGLKSRKKFDIRSMMVTASSPVEREEVERKRFTVSDYSELIDRFCSLDNESFRIISNRLVSKMGYNVDQILNTYREKDGVDFLAISRENKETALFWIRRWTKAKVGDIPVRNFAQAVNDIKAKKGYFITTTQLTVSAQEGLKNLSKVTVLEPGELGELLVGLV